jgi:UDP-glucose 4-epimerase
LSGNKEIANAMWDIADNYDIEAIIHFAALKSVPESMEKPLTYYKNNIDSTLNVIEFAKAYKINKIIFSSSCSVYGNVDEMPITEDTPFNKAESVYAETKQICENILKAASKENNIDVVSLRYFNPVGADESGLIGEDPRNPATALVPILVEFADGKRDNMQVFGSDYNTRDGSCIRDYIHVTDLAKAHIKALESNISGYDTFNIGTGNGVTVLELIEAYEKGIGCKLNYEIVGRRDGDIEAIWSDTTKAETVLGFKPEKTLHDMLKSAMIWQMKKK